MSGKISASIMCADFLHLEKDLIELEAAGIEYIHYDVMDGCFVPNYTLGPNIAHAIRTGSHIPLDFHFMTEKPEDKIDFFSFCEGDLVSVHAEATYHLQRLLKKIRDTGAKPGVAINPATPVSAIYEVLPDVDFILVMTVNPGYAGQALVPQCLDKVKRIKELCRNEGYSDIQIEVDGNVSFANAPRMRAAGADIFVAGSSGLFTGKMPIHEAADKLREEMKAGE